VRVLVIADSLAFHGPTQPELLTHRGLWPNVLAAVLTERRGAPVEVDLVARYGMTAREAWWALTKDPRTYSLLLPGADAVVLAVGNMDYLPAVLPAWVRGGIDYLRPDALRYRVALSFHTWHPRVVRVTGRWMRTLPQAATDAYLSLCVRGVRHYRAGVPVVGNVPPLHDARYFAHLVHGHDRAVAAMQAWGDREGVPLLDLNPLVNPAVAAGTINTDGIHWSWAVHRAVGEAYAELLDPLLG